MDKVTRILLLFSNLLKGEEVNKAIFCFENECSPRSFDRDIEDIRLFLSESFSVSELCYDRSRNVYFITGAKRIYLEPMEYLFLERIIQDYSILREDEYKILISNLFSITEKTSLLAKYAGQRREEYNSPQHGKALLKIHGDTAIAISEKKCIKIRYRKSKGEMVERVVIPCKIVFYDGYLYLVAFREEADYPYPAYYRLDRVYSFEMLRQWRRDEEEKVENFISQQADGLAGMYGGEYVEAVLLCEEKFYPVLRDRFRKSEIIGQKEEGIVVKLGVFEDGFIRWLMGKDLASVTVLKPESMRVKLRELGAGLVEKYGG